MAEHYCQYNLKNPPGNHGIMDKFYEDMCCGNVAHFRYPDDPKGFWLCAEHYDIFAKIEGK